LQVGLISFTAKEQFRIQNAKPVCSNLVANFTEKSATCSYKQFCTDLIFNRIKAKERFERNKDFLFVKEEISTLGG
jgi:hypothetical protein